MNIDEIELMFNRLERKKQHIFHNDMDIKLMKIIEHMQQQLVKDADNLRLQAVIETQKTIDDAIIDFTRTNLKKQQQRLTITTEIQISESSSRINMIRTCLRSNVPCIVSVENIAEMNMIFRKLQRQTSDSDAVILKCSDQSTFKTQVTQCFKSGFSKFVIVCLNTVEQVGCLRETLVSCFRLKRLRAYKSSLINLTQIAVMHNVNDSENIEWVLLITALQEIASSTTMNVKRYYVSMNDHDSTSSCFNHSFFNGCSYVSFIAE